MHYDQTNLQKIAQLHPMVKEIATIFFDRLSENNLDFLITDSYRSIEEQNQLYSKGRTSNGKIVTQVKGGYSYHNYGLAFDIVPVSDDKLNYNDQNSYKLAAQIAEPLGLEWGGNWKKFMDTPHFQYSLALNYDNITKGVEIPSTLSQGSAGTPINAIQKALFEKGFTDIIIDGSFGPNTQATIQAFQASQQLEPSGKIDVATIKALFSNASTSDEMTITHIDIDDKVFDIESFNKEDLIYVPIRKFLNQLGYTNISWDAEHNTVIIRKSFI
jgi:peptidoglycan L-alanyl-D-glutamate endopeptidase CwlK